jgi:hypothetical protein
MMRTIGWILAVVAAAVGFVVLVDVALVKVSRYRLTHGDGRERSFRSKG